MAERFLCSEPGVGDLAFVDVDAILDALEAALVSADTPLFDAARQSWQPLGMHPEVRAAWESRGRFRPPGSQAMALPPLPLVREVGSDDEDRAVRRSAYARVRGAAQFESADDAPTMRPGLLAAAIACGLLVLAFMGWIVVAFAIKLNAIAGAIFAANGRR